VAAEILNGWPPLDLDVTQPMDFSQATWQKELVEQARREVFSGCL